MKQEKQKVKGILCLPITEEAEKKIGDAGKLEATVVANGVVLLKSQMTAMEVVKTIEGVYEVLEELYFTLAKAAGICEDDSGQTETEDAVAIKLPEFILEEAGIPKDAKLCAFTTEDSGEITVMEAGYKYDLSDVPKESIQVLKDIGVSLPGLNECLMSERIIYGK